jgi:hypothetical protein
MALWILIKRIGVKEALPSILLLVSIPPLTFQAGRFSESAPFLFLVMALLAIHSNFPSRRLLFLAILGIIVGVYVHPTAPIILVSIFAIMTVLSIRKFDRIKGTVKVFIILTLITLAYWFNTYLYLLLGGSATDLLDAGIRLLTSFVGGGAGEVISGSRISSVLAPGYSDPKFLFFSFSWSIPVALSMSLLSTVIILLIFSKSFWSSRKGTKVTLGMSAALASGLFILLAYAGYYAGAIPGQYAIPIAYGLALIGSVMTVSIILESRKILPVMLIAFILAASVAIGTYSPDWASIEHPEFEVAAKMHPYDSSIQTDELTKIYGQNNTLTVLNDYDIGLETGWGTKNVRSVIRDVIDGKATFKNYTNILFILKVERLQQERVVVQVYDNNVIYYSNTHLVVATSI